MRSIRFGFIIGVTSLSLLSFFFPFYLWNCEELTSRVSNSNIIVNRIPSCADSAPTEISEMHIANFSANYSEAVAIASLQGIVNKQSPKIFFVKDDNDKFWCDYVIQKLAPATIKYHSNLSSLVATFKGYINGTIVYDSENLHTRNIAIPFCGIENAILVDKSLANSLDHDFNITIIEDYDFSDRWDEDEDLTKMYGWAFEKYVKKDKFNEECLALQGPDNTDLIDLLVQDVVFTIWNINTIECSSNELGFFEEVLAYYPSCTPILGYPFAEGANEGKTVSLISQAGKYLVASDFSTNLAFCSQLDFGTDSYSQDRDWEDKPPELEQKLYLTFIVSDGDNLQYVENRMLELWEEENVREEIPVGWSLSPLAIKYAPHLVDFFYSNATNLDYFVAGPSGAGYIYPDQMDEDRLEEFLLLSKDYMNKLDLTEIWELGTSKPEKFSQMIECTEINAVFDGYTEGFWDAPRDSSNGAPIFTMFKKGITSEELTDWLKDAIDFNRWRLPLFIPIWIHCWTQDLEYIENVANFCKDHHLPVEFVRPDQFIYLYKECKSKYGQWEKIIGAIAAFFLIGVSFFLLSRFKLKK